MNLVPLLPVFSRHAFQLCLKLRHILPKTQCNSFTNDNATGASKIERVYVINLAREPARWSSIKQELKRVIDSSGASMLKISERFDAIDARSFSENSPGDEDINPFYTLADQLFVEPQPLVSPSIFQLSTPIRMSRNEIAVAQSHVNVWKKIAASPDAYALVLEDDAWFLSRFARDLDRAWEDLERVSNRNELFDILYVSYLEAKYGASKTLITENIFRPSRGLWHLSGYVLSRGGAEKLLKLLPCRGPVDLWINHEFKSLNVYATKRPLISQRRDATSSNSYSILPSLTRIGAITSEGAALFNIWPTEQPVFAFGPDCSGLSSLAEALSMLGYRCCNDLNAIPETELSRLLAVSDERVFNAYVNIGSLEAKLKEIRERYPRAKFILTTASDIKEEITLRRVKDSLIGADVIQLRLEDPNKWQVLCDHLKSAPPICAFPILKDKGQRVIERSSNDSQAPKCNVACDVSPWVVPPNSDWSGFYTAPTPYEQLETDALTCISDSMDSHESRLWKLRDDTFTDNLALFRPSNVRFEPGVGAVLSVRREDLGVRRYSAASLSSQDEYLYGRFEVELQASGAPGVVTGFFLHRNSPRQEIDIEIVGNHPNYMLVNVFYNPGDKGAHFDYGYRGAPTRIALGFDASKAKHRYVIEWGLDEICWFVDGHLVHRRIVWDPTPIPDLPMTLHINSWPTRSTQLAGRINDRRLPTTATAGSFVLKAHSVKLMTHFGTGAQPI